MQDGPRLWTVAAFGGEVALSTTAATVSTIYLDETALVTLPGGAQARVRNPLGAALGDAVYVQDGAVISQAPALPVVVIEI